METKREARQYDGESRQYDDEARENTMVKVRRKNNYASKYVFTQFQVRNRGVQITSVCGLNVLEWKLILILS